MTCVSLLISLAALCCSLTAATHTNHLRQSPHYQHQQGGNYLHPLDRPTRGGAPPAHYYGHFPPFFLAGHNPQLLQKADKSMFHKNARGDYEEEEHNFNLEYGDYPSEELQGETVPLGSRNAGGTSRPPPPSASDKFHNSGL